MDKTPPKFFYVFMVIVVVAILAGIEMLTRVTLKSLGHPVVQTENHKAAQHHFLTGFYNAPNRVEQKGVDNHPYVLPQTDRYGFTLSSREAPTRDLTQKDACSYRFFIFGGSTVEGVYLSDPDDTIAARLQQRLTTLFPGPLSFQVINAGEGSFFSSQELQMYLMRVRYAFQPDHVIFFNGTNDFLLWPDGVTQEMTNSHPYQHNYEARIRENEDANVAATLDLWLAKNLSIYFALKKLSTAASSTANPITTSNSTIDRPSTDDLSIWVQRHLSRYFYNMGIALGTRDAKTDVDVFFQPTMLPELTLSAAESEIYTAQKGIRWHKEWGYFEAKQVFFDAVRSSLSGHSETHVENRWHDLSRLFDDKTAEQTYYSDHVHYFPESRALIAEAILDRLEPRLRPRIDDLASNCH